MKLETVGIVSKPKKDLVCAVVPGLLDWLKERNIEAVYDTETAGCLDRSDGIPKHGAEVMGGDAGVVTGSGAVEIRFVPDLPGVDTVPVVLGDGLHGRNEAPQVG